MATNQGIIEAVKLIHPHALPPSRLGVKSGLLIMLDDASLRKVLEYHAMERPLLWEEWLDARAAWCAHHNALQLTVPHGECDISLATQRGARQGNHYVLLEVLPPPER